MSQAIAYPTVVLAKKLAPSFDHNTLRNATAADSMTTSGSGNPAYRWDSLFSQLECRQTIFSFDLSSVIPRNVRIHSAVLEYISVTEGSLTNSPTGTLKFRLAAVANAAAFGVNDYQPMNAGPAALCTDWDYNDHVTAKTLNTAGITHLKTWNDSDGLAKFAVVPVPLIEDEDYYLGGRIFGATITHHSSTPSTEVKLTIDYDNSSSGMMGDVF